LSINLHIKKHFYKQDDLDIFFMQANNRTGREAFNLYQQQTAFSCHWLQN